MAISTLATQLKKQYARVVARWGRSLTFTQAGPGSSLNFTGWVRVLSLSEMYPSFTSSETSSWLRPAYVVLVAGDATDNSQYNPPFAVGGTIPIDGNTHTVRKIIEVQAAGVVIFSKVFCSRT